MNERLSRSLRRSLVTAFKAAVVGAVLVLVAAVSAYVTVRRSVASRDVLVPDVTGLNAEEASAVLRKQGLILEQVADRHDARVEAGRVLAQEPAPGAGIKAERKVKVVVSLGEEGAAIPELRGSAARGAQIALQQQGYRLAGQVYAYSQKEDENLVMAQDPPAGAAGAREGRVALLVSRGRRPSIFVMPDLFGRTEVEARRFLERAGLRAAQGARHDAASGARPGTIVAQRPEAGYPVRAGDLVTLTIAGAAGDDE